MSSPPLTREQWLLSLPQAQAALGGIGLTLLYKLVDAGSIQRVKIGRRAFITQASVDAFVVPDGRLETERPAQPVDCGTRRLVRTVPIHVPRDRDGGVPEQIRDLLDVYARL